MRHDGQATGSSGYIDSDDVEGHVMDTNESEIFKNRLDEDVEGHRARTERDGGEDLLRRTERGEDILKRTERDEDDVEGHRSMTRQDGDGYRVAKSDGPEGLLKRSERIDGDDDVEGHLFRSGPTTQGE